MKNWKDFKIKNEVNTAQKKNQPASVFFAFWKEIVAQTQSVVVETTLLKKGCSIFFHDLFFYSITVGRHVF